MDSRASRSASIRSWFTRWSQSRERGLGLLGGGVVTCRIVQDGPFLRGSSQEYLLFILFVRIFLTARRLRAPKDERGCPSVIACPRGIRWHLPPTATAVDRQEEGPNGRGIHR